jgi:hypothetical protein
VTDDDTLGAAGSSRTLELDAAARRLAATVVTAEATPVRRVVRGASTSSGADAATPVAGDSARAARAVAGAAALDVRARDGARRTVPTRVTVSGTGGAAGASPLAVESKSSARPRLGVATDSARTLAGVLARISVTCRSTSAIITRRLSPPNEPKNAWTGIARIFAGSFMSPTRNWLSIS